MHVVTDRIRVATVRPCWGSRDMNDDNSDVVSGYTLLELQYIIKDAARDGLGGTVTRSCRLKSLVPVEVTPTSALGDPVSEEHDLIAGT